MIPLRPYLLRAVYDWTLESGFTPHILVDATLDGVKVPTDYVRDGRITLNIHPQAVHALELGNERVQFSARFGGRAMDVEVPIVAVLAVFAKENGRGIVFQEEPPSGPPEDTPGNPAASKKGPTLKLVK